MSRVATSHRRRLPAAALLVLAAFACDDGGIEPEDVIGTYDLTEYLGQPLPALAGRGPLTDPSGTCERLVVGGSLELQRGANYTQVWNERTTCQDGRDLAEDVTVGGTWTIAGDRLRLRQHVEGAGPSEWTAYLRGERIEIEVVIQLTTEQFPEAGPDTPADTMLIVYRRR